MGANSDVISVKTKWAVFGSSAVIVAGFLGVGTYMELSDNTTSSSPKPTATETYPSPELDQDVSESSYEDKLNNWIGDTQVERDQFSASLDTWGDNPSSSIACTVVKVSVEQLADAQEFPVEEGNLGSYTAHNAWNRAMVEYQGAAEACIDGDYTGAGDRLEAGNEELDEVLTFIESVQG